MTLPRSRAHHQQGEADRQQEKLRPVRYLEVCSVTDRKLLKQAMHFRTWSDCPVGYKSRPAPSKDEGEEKCAQIYLKLNGNYSTIETPLGIKVADFINHISTETGISDKSIRLIYRSKQLINGRTLLESGVQDEDEIQLGLIGGSSSSSSLKLLPSRISAPVPSNTTIAHFCSSSKEAGKMQTIKEFKGISWLCTKCGLINSIQVHRCSICQNWKPSGYVGDVWFSTLQSLPGHDVNRIGDEYCDLGKFDQAAICYRVAVNKKYPPAYLNLAYHLTYILNSKQRLRKPSHLKEADELVQTATEKPLSQALTDVLRRDEIRLILSYAAL
eukprot:CAMPEP_0185253860 /NCGR_PEP_ID=MMETSP1359-20130426/2426_1 /TAXON_ID=552665 /ORGANISM="Bigelowiella longifila, Strain CCMP242" /LENGTH=327 /DNA_ID=CAMNT_0027836291 /DNA_START=54 /DNA_END=1037 /DNA_ORIENTATION=-